MYTDTHSVGVRLSEQRSLTALQQLEHRSSLRFMNRSVNPGAAGLHSAQCVMISPLLP